MKITNSEIQKAKTYVLLNEKTKWTAEAANGCVLEVKVELDGNEEVKIPMPSAYIINEEKRSRAMMGALANLYLGLNIKLDDDIYMSVADYDKWGESHVVNQIERLKKFGAVETRDKLFDLMSDYKDLEKRLNAEIHSRLQIMNCPATRIMEMILKQTTPEAIAEVQKNATDVKQKINNYIDFKKHKK